MMVCDGEIDDRLLALEVEAALKGLRIATSEEDDDALRSAVEELRRAKRLLRAPTLTIVSIGDSPGLHAAAGRRHR